MYSRNQRITAAVVLAINFAAAAVAWCLLIGPLRFAGLVVVAAQIALMALQHRRNVRNPERLLTPIPPRDGTSRSGEPMVEAFFRVREDVHKRFEHK